MVPVLTAFTRIGWTCSSGSQNVQAILAIQKEDDVAELADAIIDTIKSESKFLYRNRKTLYRHLQMAVETTFAY